MSANTSKIIAINGSHRSDKGLTEIVLRKFIEGTESVNAACEVIYPSRNKIAPCENCGKCLFETPGSCMFHDDMESIISKMNEADLLVFACPVYFDSMTSHMKKMIERLRPTYDAYFEFRNGRTYHLKRDRKQQKAVIISTAGNPERDSFTSIGRVLGRIIDNMGVQLMGEFYFPASHLILTQPQRLADQLEALRMAGEEFASGEMISESVLKKANKEYIDNPQLTVQELTQMILEMRKKTGKR